MDIMAELKKIVAMETEMDRIEALQSLKMPETTNEISDEEKSAILEENNVEWQAKLDEANSTWEQKYKDAFYNGTPTEEVKEENETETKEEETKGPSVDDIVNDAVKDKDEE